MWGNMTSTMTVVSVQTFTVTRTPAAVESPATGAVKPTPKPAAGNKPPPSNNGPKPAPGGGSKPPAGGANPPPTPGGPTDTPTGNSLPGVCSGNEILCTGGGYTFAACGQNGQYINMGRVAAGTQCINGQIVYDTGMFVNSKLRRRNLQVRKQSSSNGRIVRVMHKRQTH